MILLILFNTYFAFATCEIPRPTQPIPKGHCPITVSHLDQIKDFYDCRKPKGQARWKKNKTVSECQQKSKTVIGALSFLPASMYAKMSAQQKALALSDFIKSEGSRITEDVAEEQFNRDYQKPADKGKIAKLKKEHIRLKIQARGGNKKGKIALKKFEFDRANRGYLRALKMHGGDVSKVNEPVYRYALRDVSQGRDLGKATSYDIGNMKYSKIPPDIIESPRQLDTMIKKKYISHSKKIVDEIKKHMRAGKSFQDISNIQGVSDEDLRKAKQRFEKSAVRFRDEVVRTGANDNYRRITKKLPKISNFSKLSKLLKVGGVVGVGLSVLSIPWKKQEHCDKTFPLYPVNYESPHVAGLPEESSCKQTLPAVSEQAPEKVMSFLGLSNTEKHKALTDSENRQTRYVCSYYRRLYNHLFCPKGDGSSKGTATEE